MWKKYFLVELVISPDIDNDFITLGGKMVFIWIFHSNDMLEKST